MVPAEKHLQIGSLLFPGLDQIDLTGPFEVLSAIPNSTLRIAAKTLAPIKDFHGLTMVADKTFDEMPDLDVLHIPGGPGQQALMDDEETLSFIRKQAVKAKRQTRDDALGIAAPFALFRRDPGRRACGDRRKMGVRSRCDFRHRRSAASCGHSSRSARCRADSALYAVSTRATV
jgi:hypothetical protein